MALKDPTALTVGQLAAKFSAGPGGAMVGVERTPRHSAAPDRLNQSKPIEARRTPAAAPYGKTINANKAAAAETIQIAATAAGKAQRRPASKKKQQKDSPTAAPITARVTAATAAPNAHAKMSRAFLRATVVYFGDVTCPHL
eukprot:GHVT01020297.1.p4 GENE.GHVT01020297.1~~GHVT01020297.1.p4  ORF type:complete len:142 (-),score=32.43 GHVT01020297.1:1642-2067(-)